MVLFEAAVSKLVEQGLDAATEKKKREKEANDFTQADVDLEGTVDANDDYVVSFKSAPKNTKLRKGWPFTSVDAYNGTGENIVIEVNESDGGKVPLPNGAQNGDSFENIGITSLRIVNKSSANSIGLENLDLTVSGTPSGVSRGSV